MFRKNFEKLYLWVEKYRPQNMNDMILPNNYRKIFEGFLNKKEIPHLLLYGPPGSGKTAMARILTDSLIDDSMDLLTLNGSSSTGIDIVRTQITDFLKTPTFGKGNHKVIFLDEFDFMSQNAQGALRNVFETYHENGRFILTCNYLNKIMDPIQSRCQSFEFKKVSKEYIEKFCKKILDIEKIKYDQISLNKVISTFYPDIRKIINTLQSRCESGSLQIKGEDVESKEKLFRSFVTELLVGLKNNQNDVINQSVTRMLKFLGDSSDLDFRSIYQDLFNDEHIPIWAKITINQYGDKHQSALSPPMTLMAMTFSIIKIGKELRSLSK